MKPASKIGSIGSVGGGNPPSYLRARVVNILSNGVIMVNLLAKPLEKNLRSAGPLTGPKPLDIKVGDIVDVLRTHSGSFQFVRIAEKAAALKPTAPICSPEKAIPVAIETDQTEKHQNVKPATPSTPLPSAVPETSGAYKVSPTMLENTIELLSEGKRLNKSMIQQPCAETKAKAKRWIAQANEMIACFRSETMQGWTSNLVRIRSEIADIAEVITKLSKRIGQITPAFVIPVPENISMDITEKVTEQKTTVPQPPASKPIAQQPSQAPIKPQSSRLTPEEEEVLRIFDKHGLNTPIVRLFIAVQNLANMNWGRTHPLEEVRSLHETVKFLLNGENFDAACDDAELLSSREVNRPLYRKTFEEFAAKFDRYLNVKDIDPEQLIDNYFRTSKIKHTVDACCFYDRKLLEKGQLDGSDKERIKYLEVWLKFLSSDDNLTAEYPELKDKPERAVWQKALFREALAVLKKYYKAG